MRAASPDVDDPEGRKVNRGDQDALAGRAAEAERSLLRQIENNLALVTGFFNRC